MEKKHTNPTVFLPNGQISFGERTFFVAPSGNDSGTGTKEQPFKTIGYAKSEIRKSTELRNQPITVYIRAGVYYLDDTIVFSSEDSGAADAPVTYAAYKGEKVVVSGGTKLSLKWEPYRDGILKAKMPEGAPEIDQLFVNGVRQSMARYPNYNPNIQPYNGFAADAFSPERAARWSDPSGGYIHAMHKHHWGGYHYRIAGKNAGNTVTYEGGWQNNRQMGMHDSYRFVENIFEELDAPGEWFHDHKTQTLYFYPSSDVDVNTASFEVARLKHLVEFSGEQEKPVRNIGLKGLSFRHTARTFMETREPLLRSDWTIYRGGAVKFTGAEDCLLADCEFDQVGGNAVFVNNYNRRITIRGTHIHGSGASGICFVGSPDSVRNPLFEYHETQSYTDIDKTPGPKSDNYPADSVVEDCLIHDVSVVEKQAAGIQISMSKGITVRSCSIYDVGRAGINMSEGTFGRHIIEYCDVFDTVRETGDHGSFNSWGRDRFWNLKGAPPEELPELAGLDTEKVIIRNSRWRCDHGWDVDLDDGSSHYEIYNNVFLRGGLKLREGFHRLVYNNIAVNSSLHPHVWYENSMDVITNNIWMTKYRPIRLKGWGKEIDRNMFVTSEDLQFAQNNGTDTHSVAGDPMFIDPAKGDYRVKEGSPALKIGFKNFPMDKFGVQKPELKAIARVPLFPVPEISASAPVAKRVQSESWLGATTYWQGATVKPLTGEEFSAFGVTRDAGGLHLVEVPVNSLAATAGLQSGDLVQAINETSVKTVEELLATTSAGQGAPLKVGYVRDQKTAELTMTDYVHVEVTSTPLASALVLSDKMNRTKVFLLGGQSNMAGSGAIEDLRDPYRKPIPVVRIWHPENGWVVLEPGYDGKDTFGPEIGFAHEIVKLLPGHDIRLIKYAVSNTALHDDWSPVTKGDQYRQFMTTATAALKSLHEAQKDFEIVAMLWFQGESDAIEGEGYNYERNLASFISHMREQFKTPNLAFIIARVLTWFGRKNDHARIVRDAQVRVGASYPYTAWFDTDDSPIIDPVNNPGHYNAEGNLINGRRYAEACRQFL